jgi:hypothetical protein
LISGLIAIYNWKRNIGTRLDLNLEKMEKQKYIKLRLKFFFRVEKRILLTFKIFDPDRSKRIKNGK